MVGRSGMIDNSNLRLLTTLHSASQVAGHDPQRISKQGAVGWMVDVSFARSRIGAELLCGNKGCLFGLLHDPLVDLLGAFLAKERKSPTQIAKIWNRVFIKAREAPIQEAGSQFVLQFAIRPAFNVFK